MGVEVEESDPGARAGLHVGQGAGEGGPADAMIAADDHGHDVGDEGAEMVQDARAHVERGYGQGALGRAVEGLPGG